MKFGTSLFLLGLIHGHYDATELGVDAADDFDVADNGRLTNSQINTGIAIVVPFHSICSILDAYEAAKTSLLDAPGNVTYRMSD